MTARCSKRIVGGPHRPRPTEYNARELAALRLAIGEVPTRDYLRHELDSLRALLAELQPTDPDVAQPRVADEAEQHAKKSG